MEGRGVFTQTPYAHAEARTPCPGCAGGHLTQCPLYVLTDSAGTTLESATDQNLTNSGLLSHVVRRLRREADPPVLDSSFIECVVSHVPTPTPAEQSKPLSLDGPIDQRSWNPHKPVAPR
jgi:hypothetical protein